MSKLTGHIRIDWPADPGIPIRGLISRSRSIPTGKTHSVTLRRMTSWESNVECDGQALVDACPAVTYYCEQPCSIRYEDSGSTKTHTPDLLVEILGDRPWLFEFKADDDPKLTDALARAQGLQPLLRAQGFDYAVVTAAKMRTAAYLANAKLLLRHGRSFALHEDLSHARLRLSRDGSCTLADFLESSTALDLAWGQLARLVLTGYITFDASTPLEPQTVLSWHGCREPTRGAQWLRAAFGLTKYSS